MKKITFFTSLLIVVSSIASFAQETHLRNSKWFCYGKELDFAATDSPIKNPNWNWLPQISTDNSNFSNSSAVASVCDFDGSPLILVNFNGLVSVKGQYLGYVSVDNWNVIIVPKPNHPDRYYIVASDDDGLHYTEVDLTNMTLLNNETPLSDLNGQPILSSQGGSGVASTVHTNGTDYWVVGCANNSLLSYLVTENGIEANPTGQIDLPLLDSIDPYGTLKIKLSPKRDDSETQKIAVVNYVSGAFLKNFDSETGEIFDNYSAMNNTLSCLTYWNEGYLAKDVEFSADGNTFYLMGIPFIM